MFTAASSRASSDASARLPGSTVPTASRAPSRTGTARTTASTSGPGTSEDGEWVLAVLEARGVGREIGIVGIERELGRVVITQFSDSPTFVKLLHYCAMRPPSLVLVPQSSVSGVAVESHSRAASQAVGTQASNNQSEPNMLVRTLHDAFGGMPVVGLSRKYWDEQAGFEFVSQLIIRDDRRHATLVAVKSQYYALAAISALFKYLEMTHSVVFPPRSLLIEYAPVEGTCLIDAETAANLELVTNLVNKHSKQHLLGMMGSCLTPIGHRLVRTNLLSPLTDVKVIDARLDAVEELVNCEERLLSIRKALQPLRSLDCDKLVGQIAPSAPTSRGWRKSLGTVPDPAKESETKIVRLLSLRTFLNAMTGLRSTLRHVDSTMLASIGSMLGDPRADTMLAEIAATLNEDAVGPQKGNLNVRNVRIYAVKAERKLLLDVARETYKEALNDAFERCEELKKQHDIDMSLQYSSGTFLYTCLKSELEGKEPSTSFINFTVKGKKVEFSTLELRTQSTKIAETVQETFILSNEVLNELLDGIHNSIACLYRCCEAIAMLDMLASFAVLSSSSNEYVRPEWTDTLAIKAGRNPLHEHFRLTDGSFVPNDTYATDATSFQLITGVNMSGKSTLLRQVALLCVIAQVGCFVPASYASFRVIDALLSRLSNDDSIEAGLSTFAKEMSTMAMIVSALSTCRQSLVIIDELGRGTSPEEGVGIAHALAETIIESKAICFFATHFKELALTLSRYPNVISLHLEAEIDRLQIDYSLTFHHRVVDGATTLIHYGLELAKLAKLPADVLQNATEASVTLAALADEGQERAQGTKLAIRRRELLHLRTTLKMLSDSNGLSGSELVERLREHQIETIQMLSETLDVPDPMQEDAEEDEAGAGQESRVGTPHWNDEDYEMGNDEGIDFV